MSQGKKLRDALKKESPLQIIGVPSTLAALMANEAGYHALYLSGAGVANLCYGIPDIGLTTLENVLAEVKKITGACDLPLLVDIDTGWEKISETINAMIQAGAAGVHIEDQIPKKKCGHLEGKKLISTEEMVSRIQACVQARTDPDFVIIARTDALESEDIEGVCQRGISYRDAGADMLFLEAASSLEVYQQVKQETGLPILANITEFGKTPLYTTAELKKAGVDLALYPLSCARAMNKACERVLKEIREKGTQKDLLDQMQTREELYKLLNYEDEYGNKNH